MFVSLLALASATPLPVHVDAANDGFVEVRSCKEGSPLVTAAVTADEVVVALPENPAPGRYDVILRAETGGDPGADTARASASVVWDATTGWSVRGANGQDWGTAWGVTVDAAADSVGCGM